MDGETEFGFGDRIIHEARPEWGVGVVTSAKFVTEADQRHQKLAIRFERAGLKTISTAHAKLRPADAQAQPDQPSEAPAGAAVNGDAGWLAELEAGKLAELMSRLPESTRDPFVTLGERLKATLSLYRFTEEGAPLLDWAAMQTGLKDPLAQFNRHVLEAYFKRFAHERENQLKSLSNEVRKNPPADLQEILSRAPEASRSALRKLHLGR